MKHLVLPLLLIALIVAIAACDLTERDVEDAVATAQSLSPAEMAGLAATIDNLSLEEVRFLEQAARSAGLPTLAPNQIAVIQATMDASIATATAQGFTGVSGPAATTIASGERVNATEAPNIAPVIAYFFASAPDQTQVAEGISYFLNWTTENANRVEIFGNVMDNPVEGSWPIYGDETHMVLWAANDAAWVESFLQVQPDQNTGATLQPVTVNRRNVFLQLRDPQFVDGDVISVDVNGARVLSDFALGGRAISFPIGLLSGQNTVSIEARAAGVTPPMVAEITVTNAVEGPGSQLTGGLSVGQRQDFIITAP